MEYKVIHIDETDSTNRWLWNHVLPQAAGVCAVVVAEYQTAGKGCGSNSWESERGQNLTFSVLLHPKEMRFGAVAYSTRLPADCQFRISEAVSVALCKTLEPLLGEPVEIKWPNDIYVGDRKICGILIENRLKGRLITDSIVGIGLNVNQTEFRSDAPNPVSVAQIVGHETDREALLKAFLQQLSATMEMEPEPLMGAYRSRLYRREGRHRFSDSGGVFEAQVLNVLDDGRLVLLNSDGIARMYAFKEVQYMI